MIVVRFLRSSWNSFSTRLRLTLGFVAVMLLFIVIAFIAFITLTSYQAALVGVRSLDTTALAARDLKGSFRDEGMAFVDTIMRLDPLEGTFNTTNNKLEKEQIPLVASGNLLAVEKENINAIAKLHEQLTALYFKGIQLVQTNNLSSANLLWVNEVRPVLDISLSRTNQLASSLEKRANTSAREADAMLSQGQQALAVALLLAILFGSLISRFTIRTVSKQNSSLQGALSGLQLAQKQIEQRQQSSQLVSSQVLALAAELNATVTQQAGGSQEQVAFVSQVGGSLNELNVSAVNIAALSDRVSATAHQVAEESRRIEEITVRSTEKSEKGLDAVEKTIKVSAEVAELYQQLLVKINELNEKNASMGQILNLITSLGAETHLLSLNASIEAAGAGEYGERFRVVAQEMKNLASRSAQASKEVVNIVHEVESASLSAVESARSGYEKALEMEEVARITGMVISELRDVAEDSHSQANSSSIAALEVKDLTEVIKGATDLQQSSTKQVLQALTELTEIARQSAEETNVISLAALNLENLSQNLNLALAV